MKRKFKSFWIGLIMLTLVFPPALVGAGISEAVTYLQAQTQDAWTTMALAAAGQTNIPTSHLASVSGTLATDYAKTILALAAVGENPATFGNIDYIAKLKTYFDGTQIGSNSLLNDDMWSILALASVSQVDCPEAVAAKNFILAHQNSDGGWSYAVSGESDTNDTAAAIMALVEAGVSASDPVITSAVAYLQNAQNADGGISYQTGSNSDSGSDSWVISALVKIGISPTSWQQGSNNLIIHLESLQDTDGGFWWVAPGTSDWNNKAMTAFAVIALAGRSYPISYYQGNQPQPGTYHLRIEGRTETICNTYVSGQTALAVVENAASVCGYTYLITQESYGPYLRAVNNEQAEGMTGWLYFVNNISPPIGAANYTLQPGDEVLWYYGDWGWPPTKLSVSSNELDSGENLIVTAEYFDSQSWLALANATIKGGDRDYLTDNSGQAVINLPDGYHTLVAQKIGFVRSNQQVILVGEGVSQNVNLLVEVDQGGRGQIAGEAIIFEVTPSQLNFGKIKPGQSGSQTLTLSNLGTVNLAVTAVVRGDLLFTGNLKIDSQLWSSYNTSLAISEDKQAAVSLLIPPSYIGSGIKTGELIFWAQAQ